MTQPNRRFWNAGQDGEIMSAVEEVEIRLFKLSGGRIAGHFKLAGSFGADLMSDEDSLDSALLDANDDPAEAARFCRKLMGLFGGGSP